MVTVHGDAGCAFQEAAYTQSMLPPEAHATTVQQAHAHVQLAIEEVSTADPIATVTGSIVRVFRGPRELLNTRAALHIRYRDREQIGLRPGEAPAHSLEEIRAARVVEALVNQRAGPLEIALDLFMFLDEATEVPQYPLPRGEETHPAAWTAWSVEIMVGAFLVVFAATLIYALK